MQRTVTPAEPNAELREFLLVLRDALIMIVRYIERKYLV